MTALNDLTHLETRVLSAIERHMARHGQAPTIAELATDLRLKSKGTVHRYVQSLIEKGHLERHGTGWRGLRLVSSSGAASGVAINHPPSNKPSLSNVIAISSVPAGNMSPGKFRIPLLGRIAAGMPIEAIEDQNHLDLAEFFIGPDRYALRVTGDSMIEVGILDGDTVILKKSNAVRTGDIVVALIDGQEATLKRLGECVDGMVELIPENKAMTSFRYAEARVSFQGVLVGQLRAY